MVNYTAETLRSQAENILADSRINVEKLSSEETSHLLYELQIHQIELEMQNDELRKTQRELDEERERYFDLYDLAPIGYCTLNQKGKILQANRAAASMLGTDQDELINQLITDFIASEDQDIYYFFKKQFLASCELRLKRENQINCWVQLSAKQSKNLQGNDTIRLILNDITDRKEIEEERRIAALAFESQSGMVITDSKGVVLRVNPAFTQLTGYDQNEVIGQTMRVLKSGRHNKPFYQQMWKTLKQNKHWQGEIWNKRKNGLIYAELLTITAVTDSNGKVTHYIGNFSDITQDKELEAVIHRLAYYDPLTNLPNRRLFQEHLNQAIIATERNQSYGAIFFIDLDNFKGLNDSRGHDVGDLLLIEVSERLHKIIREGDTVARQGGDEFIILFENLKTDFNEATYLVKQIADKLLMQMNEPFILNEYEYYCKLSIGIELFNKNDTSVDLFKHTDIAMYQAKKLGGNQLLFFNPEMQHILDLRNTMEYELKQALEFAQFRLYYQPQVDSFQHVIGVEALIRWDHPQRGLIPPDEFIPLSEDTGFIIPMGLWVLQSACAQLKAWETDEHTRHLRIAVNVSTKQFRQSNFVTLVENALETSGVNPELLKLELTESLVLENVQDTIEKMHMIKRLGVHFSMDDFGTGYSSLSYLAKLPLNQLKIDRSFVRDLPESKNDAMIARTIITMGLGLEMNVIAEGVETQAQFEFLEAYGCHAFQGYLFGRPLDIDTLSVYLLEIGNVEKVDI